MKGEGYAITQSDDYLEFRFFSVGAKGKIEKIVLFEEFEKQVWNLAFGDAANGNFNDRVVSNNNDVRLVIQTVANIAHEFLEKFPDRQILIMPVDSKRKSLYNFVFRHHWDAIREIYDLRAFVDGKIEKYRPETMADGFIVSKK